MTLIQIFLIILVILAIFNLIRRFKKNNLGLPSFISWLIFWCFVIFMTVYPESVNLLARVLGVGRGVDVVIYFAIIVIFYFIFYFLIRFKKIEDGITKIVREIAFLKDKANKKDDRKE